MSIEIPFEVKQLPIQANEVAERYSNLSSTPDLRSPLQTYLEEAARIPKLDAVVLKLMPLTYHDHASLILTAVQPWEKEDQFDWGQYLNAYYKFYRATENLNLTTVPMVLGKEKNERPEDVLRLSLREFFKPNPMNLGFHPVDPLADALPNVTLAVVNREPLIVNPDFLNKRTIGLFRKDAGQSRDLNLRN